MMLRAVARVVISSAVVLVLGATSSRATAQAADTGTTSTQSGGATAAASTVASSPTIGASTSLNSTSNELSSLYGQPVAQIVARVNDRVITNTDLKRAQDQLATESRQENWSLDRFDNAKKNLLRDLIDQQLLLSEGKQLSITGDDELIRRLDNIRKQNHLASMDDLEKAVEQQGISYEDFKQNIRNGIITQQVVQQEVGSKIQISQADTTKYYNDHLSEFTHPESIDLSEILIPTPDDATSEQLATAEAKANQVHTKLKDGGDFAALAKQYSGGSTAAQGGQLGNFKRGSLAKVLEEKTFDLPKGGYTDPIRTRQGYIILEVTAHQEGGTSPMSKVDQQIQQAIYMERIQPAVRKYLTKLRTEAYIDIRPGYVDSGASPNETKPTYAAYVPPQPKQKKKKENKVRFERARFGQNADHQEQKQQATNSKPREIKHEKLRYGRPPLHPISEQQVPVASTVSSSATTVSTETANATQAAVQANAAPSNEYVQPLGPDLEHQPKIHTPKEHKTRFSDRAKEHSEQEEKVKASAPKPEKAKAASKNLPEPTPMTPAEAANRKVQNAPLGLDGNTAQPKKQKKVQAEDGKKTRFSDRSKDEDKKSDNGSETPPQSR